MATEPHIRQRDEWEHCIQSCRECHDSTTRAVRYCLEREQAFGSAGHIRLLLDCAQACEMTADFMLRGSDLYANVCAVCAEIAERCAQACEVMGEDRMMRQCVESCRECVRACQRAVATREPQLRRHSDQHPLAGEQRFVGCE
jgi:hypothetical protein